MDIVIGIIMEKRKKSYGKTTDKNTMIMQKI